MRENERQTSLPYEKKKRTHKEGKWKKIKWNFLTIRKEERIPSPHYSTLFRSLPEFIYRHFDLHSKYHLDTIAYGFREQQAADIFTVWQAGSAGPCFLSACNNATAANISNSHAMVSDSAILNSQNIMEFSTQNPKENKKMALSFDRGDFNQKTNEREEKRGNV